MVGNWVFICNEQIDLTGVRHKVHKGNRRSRLPSCCMCSGQTWELASPSLVKHQLMSLQAQAGDICLFSQGIRYVSRPVSIHMKASKTLCSNQGISLGIPPSHLQVHQLQASKFSQEKNRWCWRDGSVVKNTDSSCRGPGFNSQHPCDTHSCL